MDVAVGNNLLNLVYRHSIRTCIPGVLASCFIGYIVSLSSDDNIWLYWVLMAICIQLIRPLGLKWVLDSTSFSMNTQLSIAGLNSAVYGTVISSCILFFPQLSETQQLILTVVLVGTCGTAGTTNAGYPPFYLMFVVPIMLPLMIFWILSAGSYLTIVSSLALTVLAAVMIHLNSVMGKHNFSTFSDYVELSTKQARMSAELSDALERAELEQEHAVASNLSKTRFLAAASHDLRQPVHIISLFGAALESMVQQDKEKEVVSDLNQAIRSLSKQVNDLLDVAKLDSDFLKSNTVPLELSTVVNLIADQLKTEASAAGISVINSVSDGHYVYSDSTMLSQILRNVVGNAIKYTSRGSVTLSAHREDDSIVLYVQDTGIGMSEDQLQHIFEEFYQIDNPERSRDKGIGLGLSIVDRLSRTLSHDISITSEPGEGTCVSLRMKAYDVPQDQDYQPEPLTAEPV